MTLKILLAAFAGLVSSLAYADGNVVFPGNTAVIPMVWRWTDDSHHSASIRGRCVVGQLQSPCHRVQVLLTDAQGRTVNRSFTASDGTFSFAVAKDSRYRLRVISDRYEFATQDMAELGRGDQATLLLMPRRGPASLARIKF